MKQRFLICSAILILFFSGMDLYAETQSLLLVADFEYSGISEQEMQLLVDLYSYTIFETGRYLVMNRYERNKLLKGFGYKQNRLKDKSAYIEAGELLQARSIVTGSCHKQNSGISIELTLWDTQTNTDLRTVARTFTDMNDLVATARQITEELTETQISKFETLSQTTGLSASLYMSAIRERLLVILPDGLLDTKTAAARILTGEAASLLLESDRTAVTFSAYEYDITSPDYAALQDLLEKRNCHTLVIIEKKEGVVSLYFYEPLENKELSGLIKLKIPLDLSKNRSTEAKRIAGIIEKQLPRLSPKMLVRELADEIRIKEKLDMLLFNERFLSQQLFFNLHQSIIKPAIAGKYHPMLNIFGMEVDAIWYYAPFFGVGLGYAFSLSYPATLDSKLASHPLIQQHEIRLIPFSFRTGGSIGILINIITAIALQNAYRVTYNSIAEKYSFLDETLLISFKAGFAMGLLIHLDDASTIYVDIVRMSAIFPFNIGPVSWDGANISGGVGGVGLILRY